MTLSQFLQAAGRLSVGAWLLSGCQAEAPRFDASGNFETTEYIVAARAQGQLVRLAVAEGDQLLAKCPVPVLVLPVVAEAHPHESADLTAAAQWTNSVLTGLAPAN